jgi:hypothetical protein
MPSFILLDGELDFFFINSTDRFFLPERGRLLNAVLLVFAIAFLWVDSGFPLRGQGQRFFIV